MRDFLEKGLFGTEATFYTDVSLIFMVCLPFLVIFTIQLAIKRHFFLHKMVQLILLVTTMVMLGLFYYEVYLSHGLEKLLGEYGFSNFLLYFFILHIIIVLVTMILWKSTLLFALGDSRRRALPGLYSRSHRASGWRLMVLITLTSITLFIFYWNLYV